MIVCTENYGINEPGGSRGPGGAHLPRGGACRRRPSHRDMAKQPGTSEMPNMHRACRGQAHASMPAERAREAHQSGGQGAIGANQMTEPYAAGRIYDRSHA